ncbi:hypothetical protein AVEN_152379-1 [Araneus ventricosus]|uniref:Uncharacterized protein n=1 Tax=Araneus ventricosus TaxID=182803 RepID=A0A4Y2DB57_ARAVE|nr:hypothetical protein AVEN_152379-1 [Araneus ventricosus]
MLPWPCAFRHVASPDLSPIEHVCNITGRQIQRHPQPALTVPVLTDQVHQVFSVMSKACATYVNCNRTRKVCKTSRESFLDNGVSGQLEQ